MVGGTELVSIDPDSKAKDELLGIKQRQQPKQHQPLSK
jgi:hypothetical protein